MTAMKPLGFKAYGSTPHLPGSRLGKGDWTIQEGQAAILTEKPRDRHDRIIVTEKLDGSCCAIACLPGGEIVAVTRAGWLAQSSPFQQHQVFAAWVRKRERWFAGLMYPGLRVVGEWLLQAHGTRYAISNPDHLFAPFAMFEAQKRLGFDVERAWVRRAGLRPATLLHDGGPLSVEQAMIRMGAGGFHGAQEPPEGVVWRCERRGTFDFQAKFVRHDKVDGHLLPEVKGGPPEPVWNMAPKDALRG